MVREWKVCGFVGIGKFISRLFALLIIRALSNLSIGCCATNWLINAQLQTAANWSIETSLAVRCSICGSTPACACAYWRYLFVEKYQEYFRDLIGNEDLFALLCLTLR